MKEHLFRSLFLVYFCILSFSLIAKAQLRNDLTYELRGMVRDQNSAVIPGLTLRTDSKTWTYTDINGEFSLVLPVGDHLLTIDQLDSSQFRAFIKITEAGLNPGYLEFVIDSKNIICSKDTNGNDLPKILNSTLPSRPPAARTINAIGGVALLVKINKDGGVLSAKALRGHPLLRATSVEAAQKFRFEPAKDDSTREVTLLFVFLSPESEKPNLIRHSCPYRIFVNEEMLPPVDISTTKK